MNTKTTTTIEILRAKAAEFRAKAAANGDGATVRVCDKAIAGDATAMARVRKAIDSGATSV